MQLGFEPTHPKITELKSAALDHSAIQACVCIDKIIDSARAHVRTSATGFEPARAEPNRFQVYRLNHSAMLTRLSTR